MSDITKDQIEILIETIGKNATNNESVAENLRELASIQKEIKDALVSIADCAKQDGPIKVTHTLVTGMSVDIKHSKWFIVIVSLLTAVVITLATVILRGIDNRNLINEQVKKISKRVSDMESIDKHAEALEKLRRQNGEE